MLVKQEKFLNYNIIEFDLVNSTMSEIKKYSANTILIAKKQENGKGKGNRVWNSEDNGNLYFSVLLEANKKKDYSQVSFVFT